MGSVPRRLKRWPAPDVADGRTIWNRETLRRVTGAYGPLQRNCNIRRVFRRGKGNSPLFLSVCYFDSVAVFWNEPYAAPRLAMDVESPLTRRETEVLARLAEGFTNKDIAKLLHISYETVTLTTR